MKFNNAFLELRLARIFKTRVIGFEPILSESKSDVLPITPYPIITGGQKGFPST